MLPIMMNLGDSNPTGHYSVNALIGNIFLSRCQSGTQICKKTVFFLPCNLFLDNDYLSSQFYSFLAFLEFCLGLPILPLTLAILDFSFQSPFTFTFGLLLSLFTFPFSLKAFFAFFCHGWSTYSRFVRMGSRTTSRTSRADSRSQDWGRHPPICRYAHPYLWVGYRNG